MEYASIKWVTNEKNVYLRPSEHCGVRIRCNKFWAHWIKIFLLSWQYKGIIWFNFSRDAEKFAELAIMELKENITIMRSPLTTLEKLSQHSWHETIWIIVLHGWESQIMFDYKALRWKNILTLKRMANMLR